MGQESRSNIFKIKMENRGNIAELYFLLNIPYDEILVLLAATSLTGQIHSNLNNQIQAHFSSTTAKIITNNLWKL